MKTLSIALITLILLFAASSTLANNYYVDPSADKSKNKGTIADPFNSNRELNRQMKNFLPGDSIFFRKGQLYDSRVFITCSGLPNKPIVFSTYGDATEMPSFLYASDGEERHIMITFYQCRYVVMDGIQVQDDNLQQLDQSAMARIKIAFSIDQSDHIVIRNCKAAYVGIGVNIVGAYNEVLNSKFEHLRMVRNTKGGDDDYGANPVVIAGPNNLVKGCIFRHAWALSYDYEYDGGAVEIFGPNCHNNRILNNLAYDCNGFVEFGSDAGGTSTNTLIEGNLIVNCGDLLYISSSGNFAMSVQGLEFRNNKIIQNIDQLTRPRYMISMKKAITGKDILRLNGNVFWLTNGVSLLKENQFAPGQLTHKHNLYYLKGGKLNISPDPTEKLLQPSNQSVMRKILGKDWDAFPEIFPFKHLAAYWHLFL